MGFLYFMQASLIFPGRDSQGQAWAVASAPSGAELIELQTSNGSKIVAFFGPALTPDGKPLDDAATRPTILFFYGNGDHLQATRFLFDSFRRLGANVCIPEYEGYGMSTGSAGEDGCYRTADAAYGYLLARPDVDRTKIVAAGWSLGAAVAVDLAARRPVAALATFSAFTSMADMARQVYPFLPGASFLLKHHFDSLEKIAGIGVPTLVGHGTADPAIPFAMSERLAARAGGPVTLLAIDGAGHNDFFEVGGRRVLDALRALIDQAAESAV